MTPEQALNVLHNASKEYRGTAADHDMIQKAYMTLQPIAVSPAENPVAVGETAAEVVAE